MIVVDANIIAYYCLPGPLTPAARRLAQTDPAWRAPELWRSELRSVLAGEMRRNGLSADSALERVIEAERQIEETHVTDSARLLALVAQTRCTAYDLEYVALAQQLQVPLVTMDHELLRAFPHLARPMN